MTFIGRLRSTRDTTTDAAQSDVTARAPAGEALPTPVANEMSAQFGAGFADVRVHRDAAADAAARMHGAQAFAQGDDITFAAGRYDPASNAGRELLAHELAHVVQQRRGGANAGAEARADRAASEAVAGRAVDTSALGGAPVSIHAKPDDGPVSAPARPGADVARDSADTPANGATQFSRVLDGFALDRDTLTAAHRTAIDALGSSIAMRVGILARGKARIEIVGHADTSGTEEHNATLGQSRADRVREALAKALAPRGDDKPMALDWSVRSAGEAELLIPTADATREPRNRAVEVRVTIESTPAPKAAPPPAPTFDPSAPVTDPGPPLLRPTGDDWWKRMEEMQRQIDDFDRKHPRKDRSAQDVVVDAVMDSVVDPILSKLPLSKEHRKSARDAIRGGIESGTEKACEAAIDAAGAKGDEATALKAACKAAIKTKRGNTP